ncbi:MAG: hypothetical protein RIC14_00615 [Filomicrobium sp.]
MAELSTEYEIAVDGMTEAQSDSYEQIMHYFRQYQKDGKKVELLRVTRRVLLTSHNPNYDPLTIFRGQDT